MSKWTDIHEWTRGFSDPTWLDNFDPERLFESKPRIQEWLISSAPEVDEWARLQAMKPLDSWKTTSGTIEETIYDKIVFGPNCSRFFTTKKGMMGRGEQMKEGDVVACIHRLHHPVVLRPVNGNRYRLISPAFVGGLFDYYHDLEKRLQEVHGFEMQEIWLV